MARLLAVAACSSGLLIVCLAVAVAVTGPARLSLAWGLLRLAPVLAGVGGVSSVMAAVRAWRSRSTAILVVALASVAGSALVGVLVFGLAHAMYWVEPVGVLPAPRP